MLAIALARRNNNCTTLQNNQINNKKKMETIQRPTTFSISTIDYNKV